MATGGRSAAAGSRQSVCGSEDRRKLSGVKKWTDGAVPLCGTKWTDGAVPLCWTKQQSAPHPRAFFKYVEWPTRNGQ